MCQRIKFIVLLESAKMSAPYDLHVQGDLKQPYPEEFILQAVKRLYMIYIVHAFSDDCDHLTVIKMNTVIIS